MIVCRWVEPSYTRRVRLPNLVDDPPASPQGDWFRKGSTHPAGQVADRRTIGRMRGSERARDGHITSNSERNLGSHRKRIETRAGVTEVGGADLLAQGAVKVVEHQPDVAIGIPVQRQGIDRLPSAGDA